MQTDSTVQATLNAWQAQLEDVRRRRVERGGGHAGLAKPQQVLGKTGLQVMTALLEGEVASVVALEATGHRLSKTVFVSDRDSFSPFRGVPPGGVCLGWNSDHCTQRTSSI
jgi:hypothetical protein